MNRVEPVSNDQHDDPSGDTTPSIDEEGNPFKDEDPEDIDFEDWDDPALDEEDWVYLKILRKEPIS